MPTASYNKFTPAIENLFENINSGSDSWVIKLATAVDQAAGSVDDLSIMRYTHNNFTA